jgi:16S rRNA (guanine527-N7)-methyltransferase
MSFVEDLKARTSAIGVELDSAQLAAFSLYRQELASAGKRFNLTAVPVDRYLEDHFVDSLTLMQTGRVLPGHKCGDVGSGAGLPGVPLKIAVPTIDLLLIESNTKKADFLKTILGKLRLAGARVYEGRAEDAGREKILRETMDIMFARAVAALPVLLEYALPLLKVGGYFLAMKGPKLGQEMGSARRAAQSLGGRIEEILAPGGMEPGYQRVIVLVKKVEPTPLNFPRKTGVPAKRPLGG